MVLYMVFSLKSLLLVGPAPQTLLVDSSCSTALGSLLQKKCHMATMRTAKQILSMAAAVGILLMVAYWIYGWITARLYRQHQALSIRLPSQSITREKEQ